MLLNGVTFSQLVGSNGVAFSIDVLEWGCAFQDFGRKKILVRRDLKMARLTVKK